MSSLFRLAALAATALVLAVAVGCGSDDGDSSGGSTDFTLNVGSFLALTGDGAALGVPQSKGVELAVDTIDKAAEEAGIEARAKFFSEDSQYTATGGVEAATKLVEADDVQVLIGDVGSAPTVPVAQSVAIPSQRLLITPSAIGFQQDEINDNENLVWRTVVPDPLRARAIAQLMLEEYGEGAVVNIGARNDASGVTVAKAFEDEWTKAGGKVGRSVRWNPESATFDSVAREFAGGEPDAWFMLEFPVTYAKLGPALARSEGWRAADTWTTDALRTPDLPEQAGERATVGLRGTAFATEGEAPQVAAFDELWEREKLGARVQYEANAFDATIVAFLAALKAGSDDPIAIRDNLTAVTNPPGKTFTWTDLSAAMKAVVAGEDIDYQGVSGPIDFNDVGDPTAANYAVWQFDADGKDEVIGSTSIGK